MCERERDVVLLLAAAAHGAILSTRHKLSSRSPKHLYWLCNSSLAAMDTNVARVLSIASFGRHGVSFAYIINRMLCCIRSSHM